MDTYLAHEGPPPIAARPRQLKSAATNGRRVFAQGGDGRGPWVRRWKDICELHVSDCGGAAALSEARMSLCRRAATLEIQLEQIEAKMSEGKDAPLDIEIYGRCASHLRRILETLGLDRKARDVGPSLAAVTSRARHE